MTGGSPEDGFHMLDHDVLTCSLAKNTFDRPAFVLLAIPGAFASL